MFPPLTPFTIAVCEQFEGAKTTFFHSDRPLEVKTTFSSAQLLPAHLTSFLIIQFFITPSSFLFPLTYIFVTICPPLVHGTTDPLHPSDISSSQRDNAGVRSYSPRPPTSAAALFIPARQLPHQLLPLISLRPPLGCGAAPPGRRVCCCSVAAPK